MSTHPSTQHKWIQQEPDWVMCIDGMEYSKGKDLVGGVWVLRNERGVVLFYCRRVFLGIKNREDAKFVVVIWAFESMRSQKQ